MKPNFTWKLARRSLELGRRTLVMGILNVTPDSFHDGGRYFGLDEALERALALVAAGADILDLGGESTRPGSGGVETAEELRRVVPVIEHLAGRLNVPISVDTVKAAVARDALAAGAEIINDISGLRADPEMIPLAAETRAGVVLMHMRGTPKDMQTRTDYQDLMGELKQELHSSLTVALAGGVDGEAVVLDPGLGFAKTFQQNLVILDRLGELQALGRPLLVGPSRKSFIGRALGGLKLPDKTEDRLFGTVAAAALAAYRGAHILRAHDVAETRQALAVADAVRDGEFLV